MSEWSHNLKSKVQQQAHKSSTNSIWFFTTQGPFSTTSIWARTSFLLYSLGFFEIYNPRHWLGYRLNTYIMLSLGNCRLRNDKVSIITSTYNSKLTHRKFSIPPKQWNSPRTKWATFVNKYFFTSSSRFTQERWKIT